MITVNDLVDFFTENSIEVIYRVANEALRKKRFEFAIKILEEKIKLIDVRVEEDKKWKKHLMWSLGNALMAAGKYEEARKWFIESESKYYAAKCLVCLHDYVQAFRNFDMYIKENKKTDGLPLNYALLSYLQGNFSNCLRYFEVLFESHPNRIISKVEINVLSSLYGTITPFPPILEKILLIKFKSSEGIIDHKNRLVEDQTANEVLKFFNCNPYHSEHSATPYTDSEIALVLSQKSFVSDLISNDPLINVIVKWKRHFECCKEKNEKPKIQIFLDSVEQILTSRKKIVNLSDSYIYFLYLFEKGEYESALQLFYFSENIQDILSPDGLVTLKKNLKQEITGRDVFLSFYRKKFQSPYSYTKQYQDATSELLQKRIECLETSQGEKILLMFENENTWDIYTVFEKLIFNLENEVRQSIGLPLVGEGWVSEMQTLNTVRKVFNMYHVEHQASPFWLSPQRYDIYIQELKIAIEYQGEQHFRPIQHFGGDEEFKNIRLRDEKKKRISLQNGIRIEYIRFDEDIDKRVNEIFETYKSVEKKNT